MNNHSRSKQKVNSSLTKSDNKHDDSGSESELNELNSCNVEQLIDINQLKLFSRIWYFIKFSVKKMYSICNLADENLAWFFSITKPKCHAEIQHYERMNEEVYSFKYKYSSLYLHIIYREGAAW
ncbi:unnamed protein product [Rotaria sordida]|uniref:Uncharacterized protein n=1 Tax=Rotaria sordida TaxID=392033 RepID=A0A818PBQ6_9BILA|nr:unnamed protein product [Rotaria sordida]